MRKMGKIKVQGFGFVTRLSTTVSSDVLTTTFAACVKSRIIEYGFRVQGPCKPYKPLMKKLPGHTLSKQAGWNPENIEYPHHRSGNCSRIDEGRVVRLGALGFVLRYGHS